MAVSGGYLTGNSLGVKTSGSKYLTHTLHHDKQYQENLVRYEKEFNINISRINAEERELRESMLAYSNHFKALKVRDSDRSHVPPENIGTLQIRARTIPKKMKYLPKLEQPKGGETKRPTSDGGGAYVVKESLAKRISKFNEISKSHTIPSLAEAPAASPSRSPSKDPVKVGYASEFDLDDMRENVPNKDALTPGRKSQGSNKDSSKAATIKVRIDRIDKRESDPGKVFIKGTVKITRSQVPSSSTASVESTVDSKSTLGGVNMDEKREEITRRILKDAVDKLKTIENRSRDPAQLIARLKANKLRTKRLRFQKQQLDAIPEDEDDDDTGRPSLSRRSGGQTSRFSLSREKPIDPAEPPAYTRSLLDERCDPDEFIPDTSLFPKHRTLPSLASKPAPYQVHYGKEERGRKLAARAKQRQKARKLKFLKDD